MNTIKNGNSPAEMQTDLSREAISKKLRAVIWDELGTYEISHKWMSGASDAVLARVICALQDCNLWPNK